MSCSGDKPQQYDGLLVVRNFINNEFVDIASGEFIKSYDPSVGEPWALIPDSGDVEVDLAVEAATRAFPSWAATSPQQRSSYMLRIAELLECRLQEFAELESRDQGKPIWLAKTVDIPRAVYNFKFFATYILHDLNRSRIQDPTGAVQYTVKEPVGVAGLISPWNLPLYLLTFKIAPAMATGNTVVAKPSELTSVTAYKLCEIIKEAGVPAGVVNMIFGVGARAGSSLVTHPKVPLISFTGGTVTAEKLRRAGAATSKKFSLELGGKNAALVFEDADLDKCVATCVRSSFTNQGEICLCTSRIFVQKAIYQKFVDKFVEETKKLTVGNPKEDVFMGALISKEHLAKVTNAVKEAQNEGAAIHTKGDDVTKDLPDACKQGYFMYPTVITDISHTSSTMQEEIFGPVTCIVPFDTEAEVVDKANGVKYGLCGTLWTRDLSRAHRVSSRLQVATVWVNCWMVRDLNMPFGGNKESGVGREGGHDSVEFFTTEKTVCIAL